MSLRGGSAIIGYGETVFAKAKHSAGRSPLGEQCTAARLALADAGIAKDEVDGLVAIGPLDHGPSWSMDLAEYLQLRPSFLDTPYFGGAAGNAGILHAAAAIQAGLCRTVLLVGGSVSQPGPPAPHGVEDSVSFERDFDTIFGPMGDNSAYALIKRRYQHEFGAGEEGFAQVVVNARRHAARFANALLTTPVTVEDVLNSRMICDPLRMFEIVMPCTGAAALVLTSAERARDVRQRPVYLLGGGQAIDRGMWTPAYGREASLTTSPIKRSAASAFAMAGLTAADLDFLQLYDCYTITVIVALEDVGCCAKGEGAEFVARTDLSSTGTLPVNTDGGQLGRGQPYGACHFLPVIEASRQLMGRAGALQVADARFGLANGNGGAMANQCTLILGNEIP
ncbi:MAG: thiolase family protein [Planctomycetes bacterium]|nr:thiolase family protein [Verrucomicrobiota bacterium]MBM4058592.1 thiolase family protein [Planctomycetota bacterium]